MHTKKFNTFFKRWVLFRVGAIPRLPTNLPISLIPVYIVYKGVLIPTLIMQLVQLTTIINLNKCKKKSKHRKKSCDIS